MLISTVTLQGVAYAQDTFRVTLLGTGRPAYDPALRLKIIVYAHSRGITSSRIEKLCRENMIIIALSADTRPHFTTFADFISRSAEVIGDLFTQILLMCDQLGLIGSEMFANRRVQVAVECL